MVGYPVGVQGKVKTRVAGEIAVVGYTVVVFAVIGYTLVGFAVVGFAVVDFAVVGFAVVGFAVADFAVKTYFFACSCSTFPPTCAPS